MMGKFNLDKSLWTPVKFGDVVGEVRTTIKDGEKENIERYIGLEHIDPENIHITKWGYVKDGTTFTRKFNKGQVLFGRRRAYLKKAGLATFNGLCSGDIIVMEAKYNLLPELLPFLINNDNFFDYAVNTSAGSLSPRTKFKHLAEYQFLLPPKDQQAQIAELLWAMDGVVEKGIKLNEKLRELLDTTIEKEIHGIEVNNKTISHVLTEIENVIGIDSLENLGSLYKGKGIQKKDLVDVGHPCIRYGELYTKHSRVVKNYYSFISDDTADNSFLLKKNDVLIAGSGETIEEIGKSAAFIDDNVVYAGSDIIVFRPDDMNGKYLGYLLNSLVVRKQLNKYGTGATVMHIYTDDLKKIMIPMLSRNKQDKIAQKIDNYECVIEINKNKINQSKELQKSLINEIFS